MAAEYLEVSVSRDTANDVFGFCLGYTDDGRHIISEDSSTSNLRQHDEIVEINMLIVEHIPHLSLLYMIQNTKVLLIRVCRYPPGHECHTYTLAAEHKATGMALSAGLPSQAEIAKKQRENKWALLGAPDGGGGGGGGGVPKRRSLVLDEDTRIQIGAPTNFQQLQHVKPEDASSFLDLMKQTKPGSKAKSPAKSPTKAKGKKKARRRSQALDKRSLVIGLPQDMRHIKHVDAKDVMEDQKKRVSFNPQKDQVQIIETVSSRRKPVPKSAWSTDSDDSAAVPVGTVQPFSSSPPQASEAGAGAPAGCRVMSDRAAAAANKVKAPQTPSNDQPIRLGSKPDASPDQGEVTSGLMDMNRKLLDQLSALESAGPDDNALNFGTAMLEHEAQAHQDVVKKLSPHRSGSRDSSLDEEQMTNLLSSSALQEGAGEAGEVGLTPKAGKDKASASLGNTMRCTVAYNPKTMSPFEDTGDELDLHVGDLVTVYGEMGDDGYYVAELQGKRGLCPGSSLVGLTTRNSTSPSPEPASTPTPAANETAGGDEQILLALYAYEARTTRELSIEKGDVLTFVSKPTKDWIKAFDRLGNIGYVPHNYVQMQ